jgi:DNA-binding transcriptional ArsR family regulator
VISDLKAARLIVEPANRQILRHLAETELTQKTLSELLGMAPPSVYYHIKELKGAGLITVARVEPESHGILQKYYRAEALYFIVDYGAMPMDLRRYFLSVNLERLRGIFSIIKALKGVEVSLSSAQMERLADRLAYYLAEVAKEHGEEEDRRTNRESLIINVCGEALQRMIEKDPESTEPLSLELPYLGLGTAGRNRRPG